MRLKVFLRIDLLTMKVFIDDQIRLELCFLHEFCFVL